MLMLLCSAALPSVAAPESARADADWILRTLAQPAPMRTDFV